MNRIKDILKKKYDVIIVGAGPAGCSAATFISQKGYSILLVDRAKFPRDKICGDGISSPSLSVLERMGVIGRIEHCNFQRIDGVCVAAPNGKIMKGNNPTVTGLRKYGFIIPRKIFDNILFEHVKNIPEIEILEEVKVIDLIKNTDTYKGIQVEYQNHKLNFYGNFIIGADGVNSIIAKKLHLWNRDPKHKAFAMRAYFENVEGLNNFLEIYYQESILPCYGWIFPVSKNIANIGIGVLTRFSEVKNIKNLFTSFINNNKYANAKLINARMCPNTLRGCYLNLGSFSSSRGVGNVLLLGDAGSFIDTFTGEGIYFALRSGEYAANAISNGFANNETKSICHIYEDLWKKEFKWKEFRLGYLLQMFLTSKHLINFIVSRASKNEEKAMTLAGVISHLYPKTKLINNL